uniref:Uncharacterized protein n=1 Tax=Fagus sylvatica TaxID=28930 RepID=A0A2N9EYX8_FAGSY
MFARIFDLAPNVRFRHSWYRWKACATLFLKVLDSRETELGLERYGPANRGHQSVFGPSEDIFPIEIPARPGTILTIREFHVASEHVLFPTHRARGSNHYVAPDVGFWRSWCRRKACVTFFLKVQALHRGELWFARYDLANRDCWNVPHAGRFQLADQVAAGRKESTRKRCLPNRGRSAQSSFWFGQCLGQTLVKLGQPWSNLVKVGQTSPNSGKCAPGLRPEAGSVRAVSFCVPTPEKIPRTTDLQLIYDVGGNVSENMDVMNQQIVNLRRSFAAFEMNNSAFVVNAADCNFVGSQGSMDLVLIPHISKEVNKTCCNLRCIFDRLCVHFPIISQTEKRGAVMLAYDLVEYAKSYDLLMNEVYHSNARNLQSVRDGIKEATLCIDTSISRVAELVKECRETTGVVPTNALMDLQSVRDGIKEATLCIDTSISRVAELVKECRETTGVVPTSAVAFLIVDNNSQVMRAVGRVSLMNETLQQTTDQMRFCRQIELMSQEIALEPLNNIESVTTQIRYETPRGLLASLQRSEDPLVAWVAISSGNTTPRGLTCCRSTGNKTPRGLLAMSLGHTIPSWPWIIKHIADEVAVESVDDVTADFDDEVAADAACNVTADFDDEVVADAVCDVTADFIDEVEYAQSESPKDSDSTKISLEVADLHLAPVSCVMRIVVEVYGDSLLSAVFRKSISKISVALPILVAPWMQEVLVNCRECFFFDERSSCSVTADVVNDILAYATNDVAAEATDFVVPTEDEIPVWDDIVTAEVTWIRCYLDVVAVNFVIPIAEEIPAWDDVSSMRDIPIEELCCGRCCNSYFWLEEFPIDSIEDAFAADMEDTAEVHDSCNVVLVGDASNNIGMKEDEDVDVTKAIGLVAGVMADALVVDLFNLALRKLYYWEAPLVKEFPIVGEIFVSEEVRTQSFVGGESMADLGVTLELFSNVDSVIDHGVQVEGTGASAAATPAGTSDTIHMSEDDANVGIIGEIAVASLPPRSIAGTGSNVGASAISDEIVDFFREFDKRTPNPHPEWHFWRFNGPLLGARLGGPMLPFLSSMLAAMSKFDLGSVPKGSDSLAWKSVVQDLMEVGFDVGFMIRVSTADSPASFLARKSQMKCKFLQH